VNIVLPSMSMIHLLILAVHLLATIASLLRPGGVRAVVAESLLLKHQLVISSRARRRAPNLNSFDRFVLGLGSLFVPESRLPKLAVILKSRTLLRFHEALKKRKYRWLFLSAGHRRPGPKGPSKLTRSSSSSAAIPVFLIALVRACLPGNSASRDRLFCASLAMGHEARRALTYSPLCEPTDYSITSSARAAAKLIRCEGGLDCSRGYHLLWLPDCSGRKTEQCAECRGEPSRGFGMDRPAVYRVAQGRRGDRAVHSPPPSQRSQPKCPRLRYRPERVSSLTRDERRYEWSRPRCAGKVPCGKSRPVVSRARCLSRREVGRKRRGKDHTWIEAHQVVCHIGEPKLEADVAALDISELPHPLSKACQIALQRLSGSGAQNADNRHDPLLCVPYHRPSHCRTANERDEFAPPHHSITSSARASNVGGTSRPSTLAVFILITRFYLFGASTGRSAGFSLRMRSTPRLFTTA
jgi:hypothetical protein